MTLIEQELLTLPEHLSVTLVCSGARVTRSLVLCVCFVDHCLSFCPFDIFKLFIVNFPSIFHGCIYFEITITPPTNKISESSLNGNYRCMDEIIWRYGIHRSFDDCNDSSFVCWDIKVFLVKKWHRFQNDNMTSIG